jgi:betaine/carnitine transporter, BCCT family
MLPYRRIAPTPGALEEEGMTEIQAIATDVQDHGLEPGQDNVRILGLDVHNPVFFVSAVVIVAFVIISLIFREATGEVLGGLRTWLTSTFDWLFMLSANLFVLFCLVVAVSPLGKVRLGGPDAVPDYSYLGWFAMLFAAGMGIGLMFFGVLEPMYHFNNPPLGLTPPVADGALVEGAVEPARRLGMAATIFHWGLHPWAIYAVVALALALASYNKGLPLSVRSAFYPIFGEQVRGWIGHVIDTLAVFATLFGLATSLGFGASQALAGLNELYGVPNTDTMKVLLIMGITAVALVSVVAGLDAGVKRLSELNMILAVLLLLFVIVLGPTLAIITGFFANTWEYVKDLPRLSNWVGRDDTDFMHGWTTFYWAWWISWSPFVGMFIARVSRGRTVREFMVSVDDDIRRDCPQPVPCRRLHRRAADGHRLCARALPLRDAGRSAAGRRHLPDRNCAGDRLLRHLVRFRLAGDRHDHRRRQDRCAGGATRLLGDVRGTGGDCPSAWRWSRGPAGRVHRDRLPLRSSAPSHDVRHLEGTDGREETRIISCSLPPTWREAVLPTG